jgi:hypothetical protein
MLAAMQRLPLLIALVVGAAACGRGAPAEGPPVVLREVAAHELRAVADFDGIRDRAAQSRALFVEASRVLMHPRCVNCHPDGDVPHQGMNLALHDPPVVRGPGGHGVVGMECGGCHQDRNLALARVPGAPKWHLAPLEMAWVGKSAAAICAQMKDPARNGGKTLEQLVEHNAHDELVAWGWAPGADREPAPGTQEGFGALVAAWVETGAECPDETGAKEDRR